MLGPAGREQYVLERWKRQKQSGLCVRNRHGTRDKMAGRNSLM